MKKSLAIVVLFLLTLHHTVWAQKLYAYRDSVKAGYNFLMYVPPIADTCKSALPLVIFLHGKSLSGTDLGKVMRYGTIDALNRGLELNAFVVAPQTRTVGWNSQRLWNVVDYITKRYPCDINRIYVIGMSMGGWGTLKMVHNYPQHIAAALAMCGGYSESSLSGLPDVPLWIIHGYSDKVTPVSYSISLYEQLRDNGQTERLLFDQLACGHSELARVFYLPEIYDWLFSHSLKDEARPVNRDCVITEKMMNAVYSRYVGKIPVGLKAEKPPYRQIRNEDERLPIIHFGYGEWSSVAYKARDWISR